MAISSKITLPAKPTSQWFCHEQFLELREIKFSSRNWPSKLIADNSTGSFFQVPLKIQKFVIILETWTDELESIFQQFFLVYHP